MTEAACDQSKFESAIQGLCTNFVCEFILVPPLKSFCKQAMIKRISKQILQSCDDINNGGKERNTLGYLHKVRP